MRNLVVIGAPKSSHALPYLVEGLREPAQALPLNPMEEPHAKLAEWLRSIGEDPNHYEGLGELWFFKRCSQRIKESR